MNSGYSTPTRRITVLDAPSNLGLRPPAPGVEPGARKLARALRERRLLERLRARDAGSLAPPPYDPGPDQSTGYRNGTALAAYTTILADKIQTELDASELEPSDRDGGDLLVLLGGDCSVMLGPLLALRRRGRFGLAFVDGHDDYSQPLDGVRYAGLFAAAGLDLGLATGHGPDALVDLDGLAPYVREDDVVHLGLVREVADATYADVDAFAASSIQSYPADEIRSYGTSDIAARALSRLADNKLDGFWVHLDADVLNASVMPAVDSPNPEGLSPGQLIDLLRALLSHPQARGLDVCIYDPDLDPTGAAGDLLADIVVAALGR